MPSGDKNARTPPESSASGAEKDAGKVARAVAVKDSSQAGDMPRVIASGKGGVAEQILQIAFANDIKVREDADLVEVLAAIDVDSEIPIEAFAAVAEILSYVYRANAGQIPPEDAPPEEIS